jgi:hypothetical protein
MNYTVYKKATGEITRQIICPAGQVALQIFGDESVVEGHFEAGVYLIVDGRAIDHPAPPGPEPYDYGKARRGAYRSPGAQLDDIWKALAHLAAQGVDIGDDGRNAVRRHQAVKTRFPKETP